VRTRKIHRAPTFRLSRGFTVACAALPGEARRGEARRRRRQAFEFLEDCRATDKELHRGTHRGSVVGLSLPSPEAQLEPLAGTDMPFCIVFPER
jgi:hypothetical protein